jgi:hypothetical protein
VLYPREKALVPLIRRLGRPTAGLDVFKERKICLCHELKPDHPAHGLVTKPTQLSQPNRQHVPLKCWYLPMIQHGVITLQTINMNVGKKLCECEEPVFGIKSDNEIQNSLNAVTVKRFLNQGTVFLPA